MKQIMIDTNIFDQLINDTFFPDIWDALHEGQITFLSTTIQEEELNQIKAVRKRQLLQSIPRTVLPYCQPVAETSLPTHKHQKDKQIVAAASVWADTFVTEDQSLIVWCNQHYPKLVVLRYEQFLANFLALYEVKRTNDLDLPGE